MASQFWPCAVQSTDPVGSWLLFHWEGTVTQYRHSGHESAWRAPESYSADPQCHINTEYGDAPLQLQGCGVEVRRFQEPLAS